LPIVTIKLTDEEFNQLKSRAAARGFESISEYMKSLALSEHKPIEAQVLPQKEAKEKAEEGSSKERELVQSIARAVQDIVNPFTAKIDELARSVAELRERIEKLEEAVQKGAHEAEARPEAARPSKAGRGATAIERLSIEGVVFQSELTWLKNPKAFFDKLKREGAVVIELEGEYIAVDPEFWDKFQSKLSGTNERDPAKVAKSLPEKMASLFKKLLSEGKVVYDSEEGVWRASI